MRTLVLVTLTVAAVAASSSQASAQDRYCLQGHDYGYPGNCQFATYGQCMATASGTLSYCGVNPRYAFARQQRGYRRGYIPY